MADAAATPLFDAALARQRLDRARRMAVPGADFLMDRAAADLAERLTTVLRRFPRVLDIGTPNGAFADVIRARDPGAAITSVAADPAAIPVGAPAHDAVISGLALHAVDDLPGLLMQTRRALKPDGLFIACLPGGATLTELRQVMAEAETAVTGGVSPRVFPFADVRDMGGLLQRAGFALPVADVEPLTLRYPDLFALMADLRAMGATNVLGQRLRRPTRRAVFLRAAELYAKRFADADGRIRATIELIWVSGWTPHESQQNPLKPGSAARRLAEALGTTESSAGDKAGS
jgi:SAM-dependent methyltransferase